jgi:hypothetical protein
LRYFILIDHVEQSAASSHHRTAAEAIKPMPHKCISIPLQFTMSATKVIKPTPASFSKELRGVVTFHSLQFVWGKQGTDIRLILSSFNILYQQFHSTTVI